MLLSEPMAIHFNIFYDIHPRRLNLIWGNSKKALEVKFHDKGDKLTINVGL